MKQAEYKASRNEAKRCIARVQAEVMKKQAETLDSKEGRQNIFRIAKQKKKERKHITDITGTKCLKGDNGELLVSEEQVSDTTTTTTTIYFNEVVFPSVLGLTSPMAFPQHSPPS